MRRFLIKILLFLSPVAVLLLGIEWYVRSEPSSFKTISGYFRENKTDIEVLVLGSSHNQNGINPRYMGKKTANIAYGGQDIRMDSALVFTNVKAMKNLKAIVFELDYHRMDTENAPNYYRNPWYYIYYGVAVYPMSNLNKVSLYYSNTDFFNANFRARLGKDYKKPVINKFGYVEANYGSSVFRDNQYDSVKICSTARQRLQDRHKEISDEVFARNKKCIEGLIALCKRQNIQLYFFSTPLYSSYHLAKIREKTTRFENYIKELKTKHHIIYYDFQQDKRFHVTDFRDDDHLSPEGAKKYSLIIDRIIRQNQ